MLLTAKQLIKTGLVIISVVLFINCGPSTTVEENITDSDTLIDSTWSAKDLKRVSAEMVDSIGRAKFIRTSKYKNEKPRWILAKDLKNDTDEHINTRVIMEKIRTKLINDGTAKFIDDLAVDTAMQQLNFQQSAFFDDQKAAKIGKFVGSKIILRGRISSIRKRSGNEDIIYYNITLQAVDLETLDIIWTDESEIQRKTTKDDFR